MRKVTKAQFEKMTPAQKEKVASELRAVMVAYLALAKAHTRIAELEALEAERQSARLNAAVKDVTQAIENERDPHARLVAALAAARAGELR